MGSSMKWGILALLLLLPLSAGAGELETVPIECRLIEERSFGFVKCRYRPFSMQWRLTYYPTAYRQIVKSGNYEAMLRTLCDAYGYSIREKNHGFFSRWTRKTQCDRSRY